MVHVTVWVPPYAQFVRTGYLDQHLLFIHSHGWNLVFRKIDLVLEVC